MRRLPILIVCFSAALVCVPGVSRAANSETIETVDAYSGETGVSVNVFGHNEVGLLEYFNLIVFDDSKLEYVDIQADRGVMWYGYYPTHVSGNKIYVHGVADAASGYCLDPDLGVPGSPLYHVVFDVKAGADAGPAALSFSSEDVFDGHWLNCSGYQISPDPDYYDGGINVLGPAGHVTVGSDSACAGDPAVVDVYLHNDLDVFEYFNKLLFDDAVATVDSIVALRGVLHYGYYPTHVDGDTVFVHGWAGDGGCFNAEHSYPGDPLYRIHFTVHQWAPEGYEMPLVFLESGLLWNHWVGCDLYTTDSFTGTDGSVSVLTCTGASSDPVSGVRFSPPFPNPVSDRVVLSFELSMAGRAVLEILNAAGERVATIVDDVRDAGPHDVLWDGRDERGRPVASGVYFCKLSVGGADVTRKLVVIR